MALFAGPDPLADLADASPEARRREVQRRSAYRDDRHWPPPRRLRRQVESLGLAGRQVVLTVIAPERRS